MSQVSHTSGLTPAKDGRAHRSSVLRGRSPQGHGRYSSKLPAASKSARSHTQCPAVAGAASRPCMPQMLSPAQSAGRLPGKRGSCLAHQQLFCLVEPERERCSGHKSPQYQSPSRSQVNKRPFQMSRAPKVPQSLM